MKLGNWISGFLLIAVAVSVWLGSSSFPPESAFFPRAVAVIIIMLTFIMLNESHSEENDEKVFDWAECNYARTAKILAVTSLYSYLLGYFGFLLLTPICLMIMMLIMEKGNYLPKVLASVLTTVCIYAVFQLFLDVPLPAWSF